MGWLWSSSAPNDTTNPNTTSNDPNPSKKSDWSLTESQRERIFGKNTALKSSDLSRDAQAEKELEEFLSTLSDPSVSSTTTTSTQTNQSQPTSSSPSAPPTITTLSRYRPDGTLNIHPHALHPRTMSCRAAFDQAFYCQSLGGKFNDIYRFGSIQSCSEQWGAFWFCMRTKSLPDEERERQIVEHYSQREERMKRGKGSSEDVWEIRTMAVREAFGRDPDLEED